MHDVGADPCRPGNTDHGIEVGAVHVDLPPVIVNKLADIDDGFLVDAVRRRIGDHQGGELGGVLAGLLAQVVHVDVAPLVGLHHHHTKSGHRRAGGVGAVRGGRDQAHVAPDLALAFQVFADHQQARILTLAAGVRLQRDGVEPGDLAQHRLEFLEQPLIALGLVERREWVDMGEFTPRNGDHLAGRVQLHRA